MRVQFLLIAHIFTLSIYAQTTNVPSWIVKKEYIDPSYTGTIQEGTEAAPYKSTKSVGFSWTAKQACLFKRGTYMESTSVENITQDSVIIGAYGTGERPILSYNVDDKVFNVSGINCLVSDINLIVPPKLNTHGISISGDYASISNCIIVGGNTGINSGDMKHLKIINTDVSGCIYDGIYIANNDTTTITGCYIHDMVLMPDRMNQSSIDNIHMESPKVVYIDSLYSNHSNYPGKYALIINGAGVVSLKNSTLLGHPGNGVIYAGGSDLPWEIDNCYIEGGISGIQNYSELIIYNTIFKGQRDAAIMEGYDKWIYNCTFIDQYIGVRNWGARTKIMKNCIFYNVWYPMSGHFDTITNNCFFNEGFELWPAGTNQLKMDPLFVDFKDGNYRLMPNSPCRDAGIAIPKATVDFDGITRPQGGSIDIGAYEFVAGAPAIFNVITDGSGCEGDTANVMTSGSELGVTYKLFRNNQFQNNSINGTGGALNFGNQDKQGVYTVYATKDRTKIVNKMKGDAAVMLYPLPTEYYLIGGGYIDQALGGAKVELSKSDTSVNYQLYRNNVLTGSPIVGSGSKISFGIQSKEGIYTSIAKNITTGCSAQMPNFVLISNFSKNVICEEAKIRTYPNPSNGAFTVNWSQLKNKICSLHIYDQNGKVVYKEVIKPNQFKLNVNIRVDKGEYFLILKDATETHFTSKILIH